MGQGLCGAGTGDPETVRELGKSAFCSDTGEVWESRRRPRPHCLGVTVRPKAALGERC